jgi:hypothetical protein
MTVFRCSVVVVFLLGSSTPARADVMPRMPWERPLSLFFRFDNLSDYPDLEFYLAYSNPPGSLMKPIKVSSGVPVELKAGKYGVYARLLALPRGRSEPKFSGKRPIDDETWFTKGKSEALSSPRLTSTPETGWTSSFDPTDHYITPYHVRIRHGEIDVDPLPVEWRPDYPRTIILGLSLSLACIAIGLRIARRRKKEDESSGKRAE